MSKIEFQKAAPYSKRLINHTLDSFVLLIIILTIPLNEIFLLIVCFLYCSVTEGLWRKTPAKFITQTKVVTQQGGKPNLG